MTIIDFFAKYIKPFKFSGKGMLNPVNTGQITERLWAVRQYDVNMWLYKTDDGYLAVDSGYIDYPDPERKIRDLGIDPDEVKWVFLTHADCDHAGGIAEGGPNLFKNAVIYLLDKEEEMILGKEVRFVRGPFKLKNPIKRTTGYRLLKNHEIVRAGNDEVEILHVPGHTKGHSVYLIDDRILFSGDSLAVNQEGGWCFFHFFNMDTKANRRSLYTLKEFVERKRPELVCTGHSGYTTDIDHLFDHMEIPAHGTKRKPFDPTAPYNSFKEE